MVIWDSSWAHQIIKATNFATLVPRNQMAYRRENHSSYDGKYGQFRGYSGEFQTPPQQSYVEHPVQGEMFTLPRAERTYQPSNNSQWPLNDQKEDDKTISNFDENHELGSKRERKCMYLCIPVRKKIRYICLGVVTLFLVVLGVLLYIFIPR